MNNNNQETHQKNKDISLKDATLMLRQFVKQRNWQKYHTPRNLVMALMGQVGQIAQIFQWKGQVQNGIPQFSQKEKIHVGEQIADVFSYLIRLADVCQIDIQKAFKDKIAKNKKKYPSQQIRQNQNLFLQIKQQRRINRENASVNLQNQQGKKEINQKDCNQKQ